MGLLRTAGLLAETAGSDCLVEVAETANKPVIQSPRQVNQKLPFRKLFLHGILQTTASKGANAFSRRESRFSDVHSNRLS
jgi:hypothetical protein